MHNKKYAMIAVMMGRGGITLKGVCAPHCHV